MLQQFLDRLGLGNRVHITGKDRWQTVVIAKQCIDGFGFGQTILRHIVLKVCADESQSLTIPGAHSDCNRAPRIRNSLRSALRGQAAEKLGVQSKLRIVLTDRDCSPFVCGIWRPVLVLPSNLTTSLSDTQVRQVLLHELAHVKRRDLLWSWIPEITRIFYFFHPVVYYVTFRIRLERELSCDQLAIVGSGASAADYADTLVKVVSHSSQPPG